MNFGAPHHHSHSPQPGYGPPPGGQYQQPPYPNQQQGYPPQGGYPSQSGYPQGPPPLGPYGQPPQQQPGFGYQGPPQSYGPATPASPGYDLRIPILPPSQGCTTDAQALRAAMKGFGTDEKTLIRILAKPDPNQMRLLVKTYQDVHRRSLENDIHKETSGELREGLTALVRGPLAQDVYLLHKGMKGIGTKESFLNDVLCCRSNADIHAIKSLYQSTHGTDLVRAVKGDLSLKTETLFEMILAGNRTEDSAPYDQGVIEHDVSELHRAMGQGVTTDQLTVCSIITSRSNTQIRGISHSFQQRHGRSLTSALESKFSGHMRDALVLIVGRATDPAMSAAENLEATMKGVGTRDSLLVQRVVRCHWDRMAMDQVKRAYRHRFGRDLLERVRGETSGDERELLLACLM